MKSLVPMTVCLALGLCLGALVLRVEAAPDPALVSLVDKTPDPDGEGKVIGSPPQEALAMYEEIVSGNNAKNLVGMLVDPGDAELWKVRYVVHGLLTHVSRPGSETVLGTVIDALVSVLDGETSNEIKKFVILELDAAGDGRAAAALGKYLNDEVLGFDAMRALLSIKAGAAEQFLQALPLATEKTKLLIFKGLGDLGNAWAMDAMIIALTDPDVEMRMAAAHALARTGDAAAAPLLIDLVKTPITWESKMAAVSVLDLVETMTAHGQRAAAVELCGSLNLKIQGHPELCQISYACTDGLEAFLDGVTAIAEPDPEINKMPISVRGTVLQITVYDLKGKVIRKLPVYSGDADWDGRDSRGYRVNAGVYIMQFSVPGQTAVKKILMQ